MMFAFSLFIQGSQLRNSPNPRVSSLQRPPSAVSWDPRAWLSAGLPWYLPGFDLDGPSGWRRAGQGRCGSWAQHGWAIWVYLKIWVHLIITDQSDGWSSFFTGKIDIWGYTAIDVSICLSIYPSIHPYICLYSVRVCVCSLCCGVSNGLLTARNFAACKNMTARSAATKNTLLLVIADEIGSNSFQPTHHETWSIGTFPKIKGKWMQKV